jgi:peptidoglycan/LPS O-acetylase OafA/YrhL
MPSTPPTDATSHIPALTGLRGVASAWVALYHGWQVFGAPSLPLLGIDLSFLFAAGYFGVDLFFVLSGFLLGMPLLQAIQRRGLWPALGRFWQRRCLRVLPAYWGQLLVLVTLALWTGAEVAHWPLTLASHVSLTTNLFPFEVVPLNRVYWSLPVEWNFYLLLPMLVWAVRAGGWRWVLPLGLLFALAFRLLCYSTVYELPPDSLLSWWAGSIHQLPARLDQFVLGMFAAWGLQQHAPSSRGGDALLALGLAALLAAAAWIGPRGDVFSLVDTPLVFVQFSLLGLIFTTLCYAACGSGRWVDRLLCSRGLVALGTVSYSLYLWHAPILHWQAGWHWPSGWGTTLPMLLTACLILLASGLSYLALERPFLRGHRHEPTRAD